MSTQSKILIEVTEAQARVIGKALDLYTRIGIGQFEEVAQMASYGLVPVRNTDGGPRREASPEQCEQLRAVLDAAKGVLGFPRAASNGIGHRDNDISVSRAYEVSKVLDQVLAFHHNPTPTFPSVRYDGLRQRYTQDPLPVVTVTAVSDNAGALAAPCSKEPKAPTAKQVREYAAVWHLAAALAGLCAAPPDLVVNHLTGVLWDEDEAVGLKAAGDAFQNEQGARANER